jgi:hypothetical protein
MHSTFEFLVNYEDRDLPTLTEDEMRKSWIIEEAVRLMLASPQEESDQITSQNFADSMLRYMQGLDEKWANMSEDERKQAENYEREKAKYAEIAEELNSFIEDEYFNRHGDENNWWQSELAVFKNGMIAPMCEIDDWRGRGWTYYQYLKVKREDRWEEAMRDALRCVAYDFDVPGLVHFHFDDKRTETEVMLNKMTSSELKEALDYYAPRFMAKNLMEYLAIVISRGRGKNMGDVNIGDLINMIYPPNDTDTDILDPTRALAILNKENGEPNWMGDYKLKNALEVYQAWQSARYVPFTDELENPYHNYRCYDLRDWAPSIDGGGNIVDGILRTSPETKWIPARADDFIEENSAIVLVDVHT